MPHLIIEHSSNIDHSAITELQKEIQAIMHGHEGNFDADQCKCRNFSFAEYLVGNLNHQNASFIHITLKALSGRTVDVRKSLSDKIAAHTQKFFLNLNLPNQRCDISVDIVEMTRDTYHKIRLGN